jgi:hypothetical protein
MKNFTFILFILISQFASAQLVNGDMEAWTTGASYMEPIGWSTSNVTLVDSAGEAANVFQESTIVAEGTYAARLQTIGILGNFAYASGAICSGTIERVGTSFVFSGGQHITEAPGSLTGQIRYAPVGGDSAFIWVKLTHWNTSNLTREDVAYGSMTSSTIGSYANFQIPLNYTSTESPDTALIVALSSKSIASTGTAFVGSILYLDDLQLQFAAGVNSTVTKAIHIYPNPATDRLMITNVSGQYDNARIFDMTGRLIDQIKIEANSIDVSALNNGQYIIEIKNENGVARTTFAKQ